MIEETPISLTFSRTAAETISQGKKIQTTRKDKDPRLQPGAVVRVEVTHYSDIEITDVSRRKLGDFTEEDAEREGGYTLEGLKELWKSLHGDWNPEEYVYAIQFKFLKDAK